MLGKAFRRIKSMQAVQEWNSCRGIETENNNVRSQSQRHAYTVVGRNGSCY